MPPAQQGVERVDRLFPKARGERRGGAGGEITHGAQPRAAQRHRAVRVQPQRLDRQTTDGGVLVRRGGTGEASERMRRFRTGGKGMADAQPVPLQPFHSIRRQRVVAAP